ncbi:MAG: DUF1801 domain-containing protein [Bacteroidetes bacterium]|nr:DUF1801 domain-containing protein [Bacteroidota bacterium]
MAENKTKPTGANVSAFIEAFADSAQKKADSHALVKLMQIWSGHEPVMWGPSIIGFGTYHYRYASGHEGDMPLVAFSPRKAALTLYVNIPYNNFQDELLQKLGKFKMGKGCIYIKKLADIDLNVLEALVRSTIAFLQAEKPENDRKA